MTDHSSPERPPSGDAGYLVHTDGGASPNPGPGGWGAVIDLPDGGTRELSGAEGATTNNRMEITAALEALRSIPSGSRVVVVTDFVAVSP